MTVQSDAESNSVRQRPENSPWFESTDHTSTRREVQVRNATSPDVTVGRKCTTLTQAKDPGLFLVRTPRGKGKIRFRAQPDRRDTVRRL